MRSRKLLPEQLAALGVFSRAEALKAGLPPGALRRRGIDRVGRAMYSDAGTTLTAVEVARAVAREFEGAWVSHTTAALVHDLWLPNSFSKDIPHVTRPCPGSRPRGAGVSGHRASAEDDELVLINEVRTSSPARTWLELAGLFTLDDLIILGDHLVRIPRPRFESRSTPHTTRQTLLDLSRRHPRMPGAARAREALALIRVGADSPMETKLRLAIARAGLPEPELQIALDPKDPYTLHADLGYRAARIAIQYDGGAHLTSEQQSRDNRRDTAFSLNGWRYIKVNKDDAAEGFRSVIRTLRGLLARSAA